MDEDQRRYRLWLIKKAWFARKVRRKLYQPTLPSIRLPDLEVDLKRAINPAGGGKHILRKALVDDDFIEDEINED